MKTQILVLSIFLQILLSCSNDNDKTTSKSSICEDNLPAISNSGANTFGCCINGTLLKPRDGTGTFGGSDDGLSKYGGYPNITDYTEIEAIDFKSEKTGKILIHIHKVFTNGTGAYIINESNGYNAIDGLNHNYLHFRVFNQTTNSYQYYRSFENSGVLKITRYDYENGIISGNFDCRVVNSSNPNDIIEIKSGRFDINGYTLPNVVFP